jgi:hypothetical protein
MAQQSASCPWHQHTKTALIWSLVLSHQLNFTPSPILIFKWTFLYYHLSLSSERVALQAPLFSDAAIQHRSERVGFPCQYLPFGAGPGSTTKFDAFELVAHLCWSKTHPSL